MKKQFICHFRLSTLMILHSCLYLTFHFIGSKNNFVYAGLTSTIEQEKLHWINLIFDNLGSDGELNDNNIGAKVFFILLLKDSLTFMSKEVCIKSKRAQFYGAKNRECKGNAQKLIFSTMKNWIKIQLARILVSSRNPSRKTAAIYKSLYFECDKIEHKDLFQHVSINVPLHKFGKSTFLARKVAGRFSFPQKITYFLAFAELMLESALSIEESVFKYSILRIVSTSRSTNCNYLFSYELDALVWQLIKKKYLSYGKLAVRHNVHTSMNSISEKILTISNESGYMHDKRIILISINLSHFFNGIALLMDEHIGVDVTSAKIRSSYGYMTKCLGVHDSASCLQNSNLQNVVFIIVQSNFEVYKHLYDIGTELQRRCLDCTHKDLLWKIVLKVKNELLTRIASDIILHGGKVICLKESDLYNLSGFNENRINVLLKSNSQGINCP